MADKVSKLRTSRDSPTLLEQVQVAPQLSPEANYELTRGHESQFTKGLRYGAAGLTAGSFAGEALSQEADGDPDFQRNRDIALETMQRAETYAPRVRSLRDIDGVGDAVDFATGTFGQGVMSMAPTLATAAVTRGRGKFGTATSYAGGATTAYNLEHGEAALNQYADPILAEADVEDRQLAARVKGGVGASLEALVPAGVAQTLFRRPATSYAGTVGRNALSETLTETGQQAVGFAAEKYLDPERELDPWDLADAAAAGFLTGGGVSAISSGAGIALDAAGRGLSEQQGPSPDPEGPNLGPEGPNLGPEGPSALPRLQLPEPETEPSASDAFSEAATKAKDFVAETVTRMEEASQTASSPGEFLRQVFGDPLENAAEPIVLGENDPSLAGATLEETIANLDQRDQLRAQRAQEFAAELLNDEATPAAVKERVSAMQDFSDPDNQAFVTQTLVAQRAGEKMANAVMDFIDMAKDSAKSSAKSLRETVAKRMDQARDRIVKKNLQGTTPNEQAAFNRLVFEGLTDEAKANPEVRQRLPELANTMLAFASRTGDLTPADIKNLSKLQDGLSLFQDPEGMAARLVEYTGVPRDGDSFISKIKRITNAQQDVNKPNSFLYTSLSEEAKDTLRPAQLKQVAKLVDEFSLTDANNQQTEKVMQGLAAAFGSRENAQLVLDYYQQQNRANLSFDPNEGQDGGAVDTYEGHQDLGEFGTLTERDTEEMAAGYRNPTPDQPFSRFFDRAELRKAVNAARESGDANARRATLREYVDQTESETHVAAATRIRNNLLRRLRDAENRDTDSVQKAIRDLESIPQEQRNENHDALIASLRARKTENRTDLPRLRKEVEGMDRALGVTADELRNATPEQRAVLEERIAKNAPKLLDRYAVVMTTKDDAKASDARIKAFRKVLEAQADTRGNKEREDWQARGKKTAIAFNMVGKTQKLRLSAESMVYESNVRGSVARRLAESIGEVLNRHDVEGLVTPSPDTIVKRVRGGTDITWGDIANELPMRKNSPAERAAITKAVASRKAASAKRAMADFENRNGLLKALRDVQAESLRSEIDGNIPEGATLKVLGQLAPNGAIARAKDASFEAVLQWGEKLSSMADTYRTSGDLSIPEKLQAAKVYSKLRVTEKYIEQQLEERFPLPEPGEFSERFGDVDDASGMYSPEGDYTTDILEAEERIDALNDRLEVVSGIPGVAEGIRARIARATEELDILASGPDVHNRSRRIPGRRDTSPKDEPKAKPELPPVDKGVADALRPVLGDYAEEGSRIAQLDDASYAAWHAQAVRDMVAGKDAEKNHMLTSMLDRFVKLYDSNGVRQDINEAERSKNWGASTEGKVHAALEAIGVKVEKTKPKAKVEKTKPEPKPRTIADNLVAALHDVAVNGNYGRLDNPEKVVRYAAMAQAALGQLQQIPEKVRTDMQAELLAKLEADFKQGGAASFDWHSLFDGQEATDSHVAMLDALVKEGAESAVKKPSAMGARRGRPGRDWGDKRAVKAEILRLRGSDVKVRIEKLVSQLGGSGQYTYDPTTGERLIEVAINAESPLGTARHEAIHDFFRFLGKDNATRSIAKDLRDATSAPHVIAQLRDLLKDHKEALEQLNDPEERAAYAYQFWAERRLRIGPTGTGIFHTIRQFIRDMFGIVTTGQRAESILRAFHDGKFADPSVVQEVLQDLADKDGTTLHDKMERVAPALTKALTAVAQAAPDRLRRFENDSLNTLADKFFSETGKQGFIQNKFQQEGIWENKLAGILRGTTAVERREAVEQLQSMQVTSPLAKKLRKYNDELHAYMSEAGVKSWDSGTKKFVPLRKVGGYFARSWDPDVIARNREEFTSLLMTEGGMSARDAAALADNLARGSEARPRPKEFGVDLGFMPYAPHTAERVLTFINAGNAERFAKFQHKDLADIMSANFRASVHRAEYARAFGNNGEEITKLVVASGITDVKELSEISNSVQAMEGSLDPGRWSNETKEFMSGIMTLQNVVILPLSIFSQMIDPIVLAARTGDIRDAGRAYETALTRLKNTITKSDSKVVGEDLAEILGIVSESSTLQAMAMSYGTTRMSKRMENINRVFFKYNGLQGWNNSMRIAATAAGERYLIANRNNTEALDELGLTPRDIRVKSDGRLSVTSPKVQQAMFQFVDQAVLRPSAANRPVWMSDPRFLLVAHLKQFTFAMHNVVLKRANRELANGNPKPWAILALAMPVILASDMTKFALSGNFPDHWGFIDYLMHAVERSGLLGLGDFGVQAMNSVNYGKAPGEGLIGPTGEHLMEILRWIGGDPRTSFEDVIDRTVPGARFV